MYEKYYEDFQKRIQAYTRIRNNKYRNIMESEDFDQKLFYKLKREQRRARMKETEILIVSDMELADQENTVL